MPGRKFSFPRACSLVGLIALPCCHATSTAHGQNAAQSPPRRTGLGADRVAERYKQLLAANPSEVTPLDRLWSLAEGAGSTAELLDEYARAEAAVDPKSGNFAPALIHGRLLQKAGRFDEAASALQRAAKLAPSSPQPLLALAALALARSQPTEAVDFFQQALGLLPSTDPRATDVLLQLGNAQLQAGQLERAAAAWESVVARDPRDLALRQKLAAAYEDHGLPERALPHLAWIEAHATDPAAKVAAARSVARCAEARGDFDTARAALERALALTAPGNWLRADLATALRHLYERAGRLPELEAHWREATERAPRDLGAWQMLADFYAASGQPERERDALLRLTALAPRDKTAARRLATLHANLGELDLAAVVLDGLLRAQPDDFELVLQRAGLELRQGKIAEATARVEAACARPPADEAHRAAALAFFQTNRLPAAAERLLRADLNRQPAADEPALALARFFIAQKRFDDARATLSALTEVSPPNSEPAAVATLRAVRCTQAAALWQEAGRPQEALPFAQAAVQARPTDAVARLALGDLELTLGQADAARAQFLAVADDPLVTANSEQREAAEAKLFQAFSSSAAEHASETPPTGKPNPAVVIGAGGSLIFGRKGSPLASTNPAETDTPAIRERLHVLEAAAKAQPTAANFLRLARWQSWRHAAAAALAAAQQAVAADPSSVQAREFVVRLALESGDRALATRELSALAERDPAQGVRYRRRIGQLKMEAGDLDGAIALFAELEKANPGSHELLSDLALAQERADRWSDALATWERAYRSPGRGGANVSRAETRGPLLHALERLGEHTRALEILRGAVAEASDPAERATRFRDLLAYARKHDQLDALAHSLSAQLQTHPLDYSLLVENAELERARNRPREALTLLERALPMAPDPAAALRELVAAAEGMHDLAAALRFERRLVALDPQASKDPAALEKLAALELANFDLTAAAQTWRSVVARFPRDPAALALAQDFFSNADDDPAQALELLRRIVALDPTDLSRQLQLGRLEKLAPGMDLESRAIAARRAFEEIIARTEPVPLSTKAGTGFPLALLLPQPHSAAPGNNDPFLRAEPAAVLVAEPLASAPFAGSSGRGISLPASLRPPSAGRETAPTTETGDAKMRLLAIGEISTLLRAANASAQNPDDSARKAWLERWRQAAGQMPLEAFWAFYYLGENALALDVCERSLLPAHPGDARLAGAYLDLIFEAGDAPRLARWLRDDPAKSVPAEESLAQRRTLACEALGRYVPTVATDTLDPKLLDAVFPPEAVDVPREKLWQTALQVLAPAGRLTDAVRLGERVFATSATGRAACGLQLAHWYLLLQQPERALAVLRASSERGDARLEDGLASVGNNTEIAWSNECLRVLFSLLPQAERAPFRESFVPAGRSPAQALLSRLLLDGLAGDWSQGCRHLDELLALRPLSDRAELGSDGAAELRRWSYWQETGNRLADWNLTPLATHLWRAVMADPGKAGLDIDPVIRLAALQEVRMRLAMSELENANGDPAKIESILQSLLGSNPAPEMLETLRDRLRADGAHGSLPATQVATARVAELACEREFSTANVRALLICYAVLGDASAVERLLHPIFFAAPGDHNARRPGLPRAEAAQHLAEALTSAGDLPAAGRVLELALAAPRVSASLTPRPPDPSLTLQLAKNLEQQGRLREAADWCRTLFAANRGRVDAAIILARLEDRLGQPEAAQHALEEALAAVDRASTLVPTAGGTGASSLATSERREALICALALRAVAAKDFAQATTRARELLQAGGAAALAVKDIAVALATAAPENRAVARELLQNAGRASNDAQTRFLIQQDLLENVALAADEDRSQFERELLRLRHLADASPALRPAFLNVRQAVLHQRGLDARLEEILRSEWADGQGDAASGVQLGDLWLKAGAARQKDLTTLVEQFLHRPRLEEAPTAELARALSAAGKPELCAPLAARLHRRFPQNTAYALQLARALWRSGSQDEAKVLLAGLERRAIFSPELPTQIASFWRDDLQQPEQARQVLLNALASHPGESKNKADWQAALGRLEIARGDLRAARQALHEAGAVDLGALVEYLAASGQLPAAGSAGVAADFGLPPAWRARLAAAAWLRLWLDGKIELAREMLVARPALLVEAPKIAAKLCEAAKDGRTDGDSWIEVLETALAQSDNPPAPRLAHALATLLDARAAHSKDTDQTRRLADLRRAQQLEPADFSHLRRLGELLAAQGLAGEAAALTRDFLRSPEAAPSDQAAARLLLTAWEASAASAPSSAGKRP